MPSTFKGFKQVTKEYFDSVPEAEKVGYLWFVRSIVESGGTEDYSGDIFLGTRHYGHFGGEVENLEYRLNAILYNAGIVDESGNTINITVDYLSKAEAEETYVKKTTLFNESDQGEYPLGILIISGDDITE